jgi:ribosomal protein L3 glutamine methyltransferase
VRFAAAALHFGHGTDNAEDEALFLVLHALGWSYDVAEELLHEALDEKQVAAVEAMIAERIASRRPAAYLTGRMWFAGHEFIVDDRVLVPRSPLAEIVVDGFQPWLGQRQIRRLLDIGTGSGCIAIAAALACPEAQVDATDMSAGALAVAARNVVLHGLETRVHLYEADLFPATGERYDLIISNPPYVPLASWSVLPAEYLAEPREALVADDEGLACVNRILRAANGYLAPDGMLIVEVGEIWPAVAAAYPELPFTWLDFEYGGEGVFLLEARDLLRIQV